LATNPSAPAYGTKWDDLRDLFRNAHHSLNSYRPWQAQDALIKLLEEIRDRARAEIKGVDELRAKVEVSLKEVASTCEEALVDETKDLQEVERGEGIRCPDNKDTTGVVASASIDPEEDRQRKVWDIINEEMGSFTS
jgi:hypothetical protein